MMKKRKKNVAKNNNRMDKTVGGQSVMEEGWLKNMRFEVGFEGVDEVQTTYV